MMKSKDFLAEMRVSGVYKTSKQLLKKCKGTGDFSKDSLSPRFIENGGRCRI